MSKITYNYFNVKGRGELVRLIAAVGKIDYIDNRLSFADWPGQYKAKAPYGQIPYLEVDGRYFAQKLAISLYFARRAGLYPTSGNPLEILEYDHALQYTEEVMEACVSAAVDFHIHNKPEKFNALKETGLAQKVPLLETLLKNNKTGYFVGDKLSIVDLSAFDVVERIVTIVGKPFLDQFPLLKAHFEKVGQIEELKKYIANRPTPINPNV